MNTAQPWETVWFDASIGSSPSRVNEYGKRSDEGKVTLRGRRKNGLLRERISTALQEATSERALYVYGDAV